MIAEAEEEQDLRYQADPWTEPVLLHLRLNRITEISTVGLLTEVIQLDKDRHSKREEMRLAGILTKAGWSRVRKRYDGVQRRIWAKGPEKVV